MERAGEYENVDGHIAVVDASGRVRWERRVGQWYELAPQPRRPIDGSGHILLNFDPGRYNGLIILAPVSDGFQDFGTVPAYGNYDSTFYYAEYVDRDGDGTFEIKQSANDCDPDCAGGTVADVYYRWNGTDYVKQGSQARQ